MYRYILVLAALLAPFIFPWPLAVLIAVAATFVAPLSALAVGMIFDTLYYTGIGLPYFTIFGIVGVILGYVVQQFIKTRIMR